MLSIDKRLVNMINIEEIRQLRIKYSHHLDNNNMAGLHDIFSVNASLKVTVGEMKGIDEITLGLTKAFQFFDQLNKGKHPFIHAITNHLVTLIDKDNATGECYLLDFEISKEENRKPLFLIGLYHDIYQRIDGQWRIVKSDLETLWEKEE